MSEGDFYQWERGFMNTISSNPHQQELLANTGRSFIGVEMDDNYFNIAKERILK